MKKAVFFIMILFLSCKVMAQNEKSLESKRGHCMLEKVLSENVYFLDKQVKTDTLPWNPHPTFKGVYLKHLVAGKDTNNRLSCHIVKIEPGCVLDTHLHEGKIEIHEVIEGDGTMYLDDQEINYQTGCICVIPADMRHKVVAGKKGLCLFAKFTPALQ